jgi:site-specific DNA-methyltransferase (adenine-specific)
VTQLSLDFSARGTVAQTAAHVEPLVMIYCGDCVEIMAELEAGSIDAIVCDPPYGLEFMGKEWDSLDNKAHMRRNQADEMSDPVKSKYLRHSVEYVGGAGAQAWHHAWALAAYRVLKPGGHLVAFGGTRTFHRLTCALEDAGFEIRDCLSWLYGSGFPKSLDVSKAIDKAAGAERGQGIEGPYAGRRPRAAVEAKHTYSDGVGDYGSAMVSAAVTDAAKTWQGWGTALKPAWEPIILARKPLGERNVAANVLRHGTGAINVDGCRVETDEDRSRPAGRFAGATYTLTNRPDASQTHPLGRWPANLVLDDAAAALLDEQSGERPTGDINGGAGRRRGRDGGFPIGVAEGTSHRGDTGGASRFFKVVTWTDDDASDAARSSCRSSEADASARNDVPTVSAPTDQPVTLGQGSTENSEPSISRPSRASSAGPQASTATIPTTPTSCGSCGSVLPATAAPTSPGDAARAAGVNVRVGGTRFHYDAKADTEDRDGSTHPTVKPVDLMKWLIKLVTPSAGVVLDPFLGSGTTAYAARALGIRSIGIEREAVYIEETIWRLRQGVLL